MFIGRKEELSALTELTKKTVASLVVCKGRRRIGKSSLSAEFGHSQKNFMQFQGLSPRAGQTNQNQLNHFAEQLSKQSHAPKYQFDSWTEAFERLASVVKHERTLILLDEISWMASKDKDFAGRLKVAWDNFFAKKSKLILIVCGSVSSWIEENILNSADFVGRISTTIDLKEMTLAECNQFIDPKDRIQTAEKAKILSVTGGVPRYLEEINPKSTAEQNIKSLCFQPEGFLFNEFERIFNDIFDKRATKYRDIVRLLLQSHLNAKELCEKLKMEQNGVFSKYLEDLEHSGFIARDFSRPLGSEKKSKLSRYRVVDNYLRFYLQYIEPHKSKIARGLYRNTYLGSLPQWNTVMALQFENLILANTRDVLGILKIDPHLLINAGPYFQTKNARTLGACQIDLLIELRRNVAYVCEIKFRQKITATVISEVQRKIEVLKKPKNFSLRPILVYEGEIDEKDEDDIIDYFDHLIPFSKLLT